MGKNKVKYYDLLVIGGGAAGMVAAITGARNNKRVAIIEKLDKLGKKILATGNGKCNFTHENITPEFYNTETMFMQTVLDKFSVEDCLNLFHSIGIYPKNKNGYYYPNSEQASSVVVALLQELKRLQVTICYETMVTDIFPEENGVCVETNKGSFYGDNVIIATGLLASPKLGSDGSLFDIIKNLGHRFQPILPALCGYHCKGINFKKTSGVRAYGTVSALINDMVVSSDTGEIQFTDYGLSGIPVFQISRYLSKALYDKCKVEVIINLLPDFDENELLDELQGRKLIFAEETVPYLLNGLINQKLASMILEKSHISEELYISCLSDKDLESIVFCIQNLKVKVTNYRDFEFAQVCIGGIPISDINPETFESKLAKHIYFTGEILDVDGVCGGYNLHFAWASGYIAALSATER